jgi:glycosyltransferase involved in cell wall biosynthesis
MLGLSIPLLNEEALVEAVFDGIRSALADLPHTLALVNNGSTDATGTIIDTLARHPGVIAVHLTVNAGYGGGILAGLDALRALPTPPTVIGWCWGDDQIDPTVLPALYRRCQEGADLAKIRRTRREDGHQRRLISASYAAIMSALGLTTPDINGCPKLFRAEVLDRLALSHADWFLDAEAILKAESAGLRIEDVPAVMRPRAAGKSKVGLRTVAEFGLNITRYRLTGWK